MRTALRKLRSLGPAVVVLTAACATLPTDYPPPPPSVALEPDPATTIGRTATRFSDRNGAGTSGYLPIDLNSDGLRWRLALVDSAERSLDLLYYVWYDDHERSAPARARHRGRRARRPGAGGGRRHAVHQWQARASPTSTPIPTSRSGSSTPGRARSARGPSRPSARAKKLNTRMHNKLLIADSQMAILGGRNIGDHYFGLHHKYNFHDLDWSSSVTRRRVVRDLRSLLEQRPGHAGQRLRRGAVVAGHRR